MSEMIRRVAKAICPEFDFDPRLPDRYAQQILRENTLHQARAAIEAMRDHFIKCGESGSSYYDGAIEELDAALGIVGPYDPRDLCDLTGRIDPTVTPFMSKMKT